MALIYVVYKTCYPPGHAPVSDAPSSINWQVPVVAAQIKACSEVESLKLSTQRES